MLLLLYDPFPWCFDLKLALSALVIEVAIFASNLRPILIIISRSLL